MAFKNYLYVKQFEVARLLRARNVNTAIENLNWLIEPSIINRSLDHHESFLVLFKCRKPQNAKCCYYSNVIFERHKTFYVNSKLLKTENHANYTKPTSLSFRFFFVFLLLFRQIINFPFDFSAYFFLFISLIFITRPLINEVAE